MKKARTFPIDRTYRHPGMIDDDPLAFLKSASKSKSKPRAKQEPAKKQSILDAVEAIWSGKIPKSMVKQRDEEIQRWIKERGLPKVDARTIRRVLQDM
jgi:hypothetical protein